MLTEKKTKNDWLLVGEETSKSIYSYIYTAMFGFMNVIFVRMSCIDYPFRNQLRKSITDTLRNDGIHSFVRGAPAMAAAQMIGHIGFTGGILVGELGDLYFKPSKEEE